MIKRDCPGQKLKLSGGCPFLNSASNIKNPQLEHLEPSFNIHYVSKYWCLFEKNINYPEYLINAIFHCDEKYMTKLREKEISEIYFVWSNYKEIANKYYFSQDYEESLEYHEKALNCLRWLKIKKTNETINNEILNIITNENIIYEELKINSEDDSEMYLNLTLSTLLNIINCYLKLKYFKQAWNCILDAEKLKIPSSQIYFRKSQCIIYNKKNCLEKLKNAYEFGVKAIEIKRKEAIFRNENIMLLKISGLDKVEDIYRENLEIIKKKIIEKEKEETDYVLKIFGEEKRVELYEEEYKLIKTENKNLIFEENVGEFEINVIKKFLKKLKKLMKYKDSMSKIELSYLKNEYLKTYQIYYQMKFYDNLDFKNFEKNSIILRALETLQIDIKKNENRLKKFCKIKIQELFLENKYNSDIFKSVLSKYIKKNFEKQVIIEKKEKPEKSEIDNDKKSTLRNFYLKIMILILFFTMISFIIKYNFF